MIETIDEQHIKIVNSMQSMTYHMRLTLDLVLLDLMSIFVMIVSLSLL